VEKSKTAIKWQTDPIHTHRAKNTFCIIENFVLFLEIANQTHKPIKQSGRSIGYGGIVVTLMDSSWLAGCYRRFGHAHCGSSASPSWSSFWPTCPLVRLT